MTAPPTLLTRFLDDAAARYGDRLAVEDQTRSLSYAAIHAASLRIAGHLTARGVKPGDRVVLSMTNSAAFCAAFWGALRAGACVVPLNPETRIQKLRFIFADCTPVAVIADDTLTETLCAAAEAAGLSPLLLINGEGSALAQLIDAAPAEARPQASEPAMIDQDLAAIIYTSGSTGDPKGVMLSHLNMTTAARSVAQYLGYRAEDRIFCCIPMTFDYGLHQLTMATLTGATLLVEPSFAQPLFALKRLAQSGASVFPIVPTMVPLIAPLADRFDLARVRLVSSTSAALHGRFIDGLSAMFPAARIFSMYGLTECHRCTYLDPAELEQRKSSVGKAIPNTRMWVVDAAGVAHDRDAVGELVIRGATVMRGYWNNPEKTAQKLRPGPLPGEMVLYTGDTCRIDAEGFLYFIARSDDILKVRGEKVAPSEVDAVLVRHPQVAETCAFGVEHPVYGQQCVAAVVVAPGADAPDAEALRRWCLQHLEPHAVPADLWLTPQIPRNGNNKVDRQALLALYQKARAERRDAARQAPSAAGRVSRAAPTLQS
ncbi:MAG: class I adenylate-forming enzyme family protein [Paenirhodobacter sp.]|uniref:class I adenylate-forming enzyme family protein n=1 Tax=Paenirhodobacter sp. TaxID=1965326 RepID=UPI003D12D2A1